MSLERQLIKEYIGSHYFFLLKYLNGGYETYVSENLDKITKKTVFGKRITRLEYRFIGSEYILEQTVLRYCKDTLNYINENKSKN